MNLRAADLMTTPVIAAQEMTAETPSQARASEA